MVGNVFSATGRLAAFIKRTTITTDSNVFPPETNKITNVSRIRREKVWIVCDGRGKMNCIHLNPTKMIEEFDKLKRKGKITEEQYRRVTDALLDGITGDRDTDT